MASSVITPKKSVYFVGPGSTGKTTLAKALVEKCTSDTFMLTEVGRTVFQNSGYVASDISDDPTKCYNLQKAILLVQCQKEKELLDTNRRCISDRSAIDPIVYAKFYIKVDTFESLTDLEDWRRTKLKYQDENVTLIVLIEPNQAFLKDDGTRKLPNDSEDWFAFYKCFISFMTQNEIPFKIIPENLTDINQRVDQVIEWMQS